MHVPLITKLGYISPLPKFWLTLHWLSICPTTRPIYCAYYDNLQFANNFKRQEILCTAIYVDDNGPILCWHAGLSSNFPQFWLMNDKSLSSNISCYCDRISQSLQEHICFIAQPFSFTVYSDRFPWWVTENLKHCCSLKKISIMIIEFDSMIEAMDISIINMLVNYMLCALLMRNINV